VLNDLGALVRFLRVPQMDGQPDFLNYVAGPIERRQAFGLERLRNLLQCICLRRTKDILQFPEPDTRIELVQFTQEERTRYCRIGEEHRKAIDQAIERRNCRDASSGLFRAIMRLRIFCNSGLCGDSRNNESTTDESLSLIEQEGQASCSYCSCDITSVGEQGSASSYVLLSCSHLLCLDCISRSKQEVANLVCCIVCGTTCSSLDSVQKEVSILEEPLLNLRGYSSKLQAVVQDVMLNPTEKWYVHHYSPVGTFC
jgi:SWI/SNF-related matrix-associated actin-dependent regulator of chromatin subfamily A3